VVWEISGNYLGFRLNIGLLPFLVVVVDGGWKERNFPLELGNFWDKGVSTLVLERGWVTLGLGPQGALPGFSERPLGWEINLFFHFNPALVTWTLNTGGRPWSWVIEL